MLWRYVKLACHDLAVKLVEAFVQALQLRVSMRYRARVGQHHL
jgi:hypothetical protein